jgi:hypothetical protein
MQIAVQRRSYNTDERDHRPETRQYPAENDLSIDDQQCARNRQRSAENKMEDGGV